MKRLFVQLLAAAAAFIIMMICAPGADACTGITLRAADGSIVMARTIEWGQSELPSQYVIVPRGVKFTSYTPTGQNGMKYVSKYGIAGISVVSQEFIAEGINEAGLSAGLFYFPAYGKYPEYDPKYNDSTISDLQFVSWILSSFSTVEQVKQAVRSVRITALEGDATVHWRVGDVTGKQIVIEVVDAQVRVYDNPAGVLTNAPGFEWQMTNLNNYVNLFPGSASVKEYSSVTLFPFGAGSGMLGLPGDVTPPSRFVRAFFYQSAAPLKSTGTEAVAQCFTILNNFDIPVGVEFEMGQAPDIPSATQWTSVTDLKGRKLYFRTMYDSTVRCIDLSGIDFSNADYIARPLDEDKSFRFSKIEL